MPSALPAMPRVVFALATLLVVKVTIAIVVGYRDYFPPNFQSDFLLGRERYFWGTYRYAFHVHLASGPLSLLLGTLLLSNNLRARFPGWHRWLGRLQAANILLLLVPSGLWMAWYAATGAVAGAGLASLAAATALSTVLGVRAAVARQFAEHRRWMHRSYLLLCSAVVIRLIGGLATLANFDALWLYPFSAWASWLAPLALLEGMRVSHKAGSDSRAVVLQ